uniref:Integrase zinc-binding domain-containing protein n=1 Tax=Globisporangium ultimum (strain ATCC 200006 / CBS 805.95 / DAOM BR144) TaxID=431595 RepID=K3X5E5_GLOUD
MSDLAEYDLHLLFDEILLGATSGSRWSRASDDYNPSNSAVFNVTTVHLGDSIKSKIIRAYKTDPVFKDCLKKVSSGGKSDLPAGEVTLIDGLLYLAFKDRVPRLCIPADDQLHTQIIAQFHDGPVAAHPGIRRTQLSMRQCARSVQK